MGTFQEAKQYCIGQVDRLLEQFPLSWPEEQSKNYVYPKGCGESWTEGFWPGMLNLAYEMTGDEKYKKAALAQVELFREELQLKGRALSGSERRFLESWADWGFGPEAVALAYDRTVEHTGKLSWAYMNKILQSWAAEGFTTPEQVRDWDGKFKQQSKSQSAQCLPKKSKFNNYEDTNQTDYAKLEEQLLDMMLDHEG